MDDGEEAPEFPPEAVAQARRLLEGKLQRPVTDDYARAFLVAAWKSQQPAPPPVHYGFVRQVLLWAVSFPTVTLVLLLIAYAAAWQYGRPWFHFVAAEYELPVVAAACAILLVWIPVLLAAAYNPSGSSIPGTHEWRIVGSGAKHRDATEREVYEHRHGHGAWDAAVQTTKLGIGIVGTLLAPVIGLALVDAFSPTLDVWTHGPSTAEAWTAAGIGLGVWVVAFGAGVAVAAPVVASLQTPPGKRDPDVDLTQIGLLLAVALAVILLAVLVSLIFILTYAFLGDGARASLYPGHLAAVTVLCLFLGTLLVAGLLGLIGLAVQGLRKTA
jgi:hypothetical protein